jgi:hypothetical protein
MHAAEPDAPAPTAAAAAPTEPWSTDSAAVLSAGTLPTPAPSTVGVPTTVPTPGADAVALRVVANAAPVSAEAPEFSAWDAAPRLGAPGPARPSSPERPAVVERPGAVQRSAAAERGPVLERSAALARARGLEHAPETERMPIAGRASNVERAPVLDRAAVASRLTWTPPAAQAGQRGRPARPASRDGIAPVKAVSRGAKDACSASSGLVASALCVLHPCKNPRARGSAQCVDRQRAEDARLRRMEWR